MAAGERGNQKDDIDLADDLTWTDLDGAFRALREADPVYWSEGAGAWVVTGHEAAVSILKDGQRFRADPTAADGGAGAMLRAAAEGSPLPYHGLLAMLDGERHRALRSVVSGCYAAAAVEQYRPAIRARAQALVAACGAGQTFDAIDDLARPLARFAVALPLGVVGRDADAFIDAAEALMEMAQPQADTREAGDQLLAEARVRLSQIEVEAQPNGALAAIARGRDCGEVDEEAAFGLAVFLGGVGQGPMRLAIGNGLLALLRNSSEYGLLQESPAAAGGLLDEALRFSPPIQVLRRFAACDTMLEGRRIVRGEMLEIIVPAANRDPAHFPDPHRFAVARGARDHLGFGWGPHMCMGAPLARVIAEELAGALVRGRPALRMGHRLEILAGETTGPLTLELLGSTTGAGCPVEGARTLADASVPAAPRNHACPCGSGRKYKRCHGTDR